MIYTAEIARADVPNKNGRIYSTSVLQSIIDNNPTPIFGTLGYNKTGLGLNIKDMSHTVSNLRLENGILYGDVTVLGTPPGRIIEELIDAGHAPAFRLNGFGRMDVVDGTTVISDYTLQAIVALSPDTAA